MSSTETPETRSLTQEKTTKEVEVTSHIGYNTYFIQVPTSAETSLSGTERQDVTYVRAPFVDDRSSCRCSCTKDWYSARHASTSLPLVQPFSSSPSKSLLKSSNGATSSPPTTIAGQKQINPCPMTERAATVDRTQFTKSSKNRRASRRNSLCRYWLPTLPSAAITRVPWNPENKRGISMEQHYCVPRGGPTRFPGTTSPPPPWKRNKFMGLLTDFKKEMQQTKLHACHLVHVKVPVNSLLLKHNAAQLGRVRKQRRCDQTRERPYHKTIPIVSASRLLQIGDNQGPDAYDVRNDVDQMGHTQATSNEPKIKDWVVNEFLAIPTAQVFAKGFNKHSRATDDRSYRHVRPKCINHPTQCSDFLMRIAAVAIQGGHTNSPEGVHIPSAQKHPHLVTFLLKLHTAAPV